MSMARNLFILSPSSDFVCSEVDGMSLGICCRRDLIWRKHDSSSTCVDILLGSISVKRLCAAFALFSVLVCCPATTGREAHVHFDTYGKGSRTFSLTVFFW